MDGLSVLSVAASVAQFIEFGSSLVSKSQEIYDSANGALAQNVESAAAAQRLLELTKGLKNIRIPRDGTRSPHVEATTISAGDLRWLYGGFWGTFDAAGQAED